MLHSAILLTKINLLPVFKTFVLSIFEWPLKTGFTVCYKSTSADEKVDNISCEQWESGLNQKINTAIMRWERLIVIKS